MVLTGALAQRLTITGSRVNGVAASIRGEATDIQAGVTILCAGSIGSPLLLMRSGIGPAVDLARAGVSCVANHPEIGENLHDHLLTAGNVYRARRPVPPSRLQHSESLTYLDSSDLCRDGACRTS